jgi:hypothetical protein
LFWGLGEQRAGDVNAIVNDLVGLAGICALVVKPTCTGGLGRRDLAAQRLISRRLRAHRSTSLTDA